MWVRVQKHLIYGKYYIWNPATCSWKNDRYVASIIDNSVITHDDIIDAEETKTIPKNMICETKVSVYYLPFC